MANLISIATLFDLFKTKKGWEKPGHKYLYRVPLPAGGYRYYYKYTTGKKSTDEPDYEDFTEKQSDRFDKDQKFVSEQDEAVEEFLNFRSDADAITINGYVKDIKAGNFTAFYGRTWEIFAALPDVKNFNDAIMKVRYYLDNFKDEHHQKILGDLVNRIAALKETENGYHLDRLVDDNKVMWNYIKQVSSLAHKIDFKNLRVLSTAHIQRGDIVADLHVIDVSKAGAGKNNDLGLFMLDLNSGIPNAVGISSKAFEGISDINLKTNSAAKGVEKLTAAADRLLTSGDSKGAHSMRQWAAKMKRAFDDAKGEAQSISKAFPEHKKDQERIDYLKKQGAHKFQDWIKNKRPERTSMSVAQHNIYDEYRTLTKKINHAQNTFRSMKLQEVYFNAFQDDTFNRAFTDELYDVFSGAFHDTSVSEMIMIMPFFDRKTKAKELFIVRESKLRKELKKLLSPGNFSFEMKSLGPKSIMGKDVNDFSNINIFVNIGGKKTKMGTLRFRRDEAKMLTLMDPDFMLGFVRKNNEAGSPVIDNEFRSRGLHEGLDDANKSFLLQPLFKSTPTTERKKMNAKYIRKELTESGKVRYIYKETNPRAKKVQEAEPVRRNQFSSTVDSVDPAYKALFEESCSEIADEHFININAGCASIRFTKDVDTFLDALDVPKELRDSEEFATSSGSFNVSKGKMAFCTTNFPSDISEIVKKAVMLHEVGHAYFYGTLRIKAKKPLTADAVDSKDKDQKGLVKNATKFVDTFGKMDAELRKKAEFDVADVKGADKETLLQESIKTYMVSEYATLSGEEHFAEAFSRYFIMPEQLKKKELEVYNHFEAFFQKYGE